MSLRDWSTTAASNTSSPPNGAPEGMTLANVNNVMRQIMADVRTLAAEDTIASATTCDLGTKDATFLTVSGTTTITGFGTVSAGIYKFVRFSGALTLTHNATSLILLTAANRTTVAGDIGLYKSEGSGNWREYFYSGQTSYQPLDSDLTAISALTTTATGRSLLAIASAAAGRTILDSARLTSSLTAASPATGDYINISDVSDSGNEKKALVSDLLGLYPQAKAYMNFNGTGVAAARDSYNCTLTDNGTGDYTITFVSAMADANYKIAITFSANYGVRGGGLASLHTQTGWTEVAPTVNEFRFITSDSSGAPFDPKYVMVIVY